MTFRCNHRYSGCCTYVELAVCCQRLCHQSIQEKTYSCYIFFPKMLSVIHLIVYPIRSGCRYPIRSGCRSEIAIGLGKWSTKFTNMKVMVDIIKMIPEKK